MNKGAIISDDMKYRYLLHRIWKEPFNYVLFIGLNPSTADADNDDPTIRRCIRFAKDWGYDGIYMLNLFAYRATKPENMMADYAPIGPDNDAYLKSIAENASVIVCAWGTKGKHQGRDKQVISLLEGYRLKCLEKTKDGHPRHPLYVKADKLLEPFE